MSDLPENWVSAVLSDISTVEMGQSPDSSTYNEKGKGLPFFQGKAEFGKLHPTVRKWCTDPKKIAEAGDILLSVRAPVGPTNVALEKCCIGRGLAAIRAKESIDQKYLLLYFRNIESWLSQQGTGTTFTAISGSFIRDLQVPVAPLDEQKRIAEKLDSLLTRVDSCEHHLERVPQILKRFRQSVLAAATSGRLTEDWREENAVNGEWEESTFGLVGSVSGGLTKNQKRNLIEWRKPYLRVANVYANKLELEDVADIGLTETEFEKTKLLKDDLLIVEGNGSLEQIGRAAIWNNEVVDCVHQNHIIRWRTNGNVIPKFALFWLLSPEGRSFMVGIASSTTGLHTLSISKVSSIPIRVPSPEEQAEIVRRVEKLFAYAERLEARYYSASEHVERLTPSLLAKGFRGELVEQDPNDESAEKLLERVKAGREDVQPQKAGLRGRKGKK